MDPAPPATAPARCSAAGTPTFPFTGVDGSTLLGERDEATMRAVTARHHALPDSSILRVLAMRCPRLPGALYQPRALRPLHGKVRCIRCRIQPHRRRSLSWAVVLAR